MARIQPTQPATTDAGRRWPRDWPELEITDFTVTPSDLESVLVTVRGRWLGSPPASPGLPILVIEDGPLSHRFGALPEPPETQTETGSFQAEFSIPSELRPALAAPLLLDLGGAALPLPADAPRTAPPVSGAGTVVDPLVLADRRALRAELSERAHAQRADQAERARDAVRADLAELDRRLRVARERRADLQAELAERARALRETAQDAHAERALREELVAEERARRERAEREARALRERFSQAEARARELVHDVETLRRAELENEQAVAAAAAARRQAERELDERERRVAAAEAAAGKGMDLAALERRVAALGEQLERERAERSLARTQLADERERAVALEGELTRTRARVEEKAEELALATSLVSDLVSAGELLLARLDEERKLSERGERDAERVEGLIKRLAEAERRGIIAEAKLARTLCDLALARSTPLQQAPQPADRVAVAHEPAWSAPAPAPEPFDQLALDDEPAWSAPVRAAPAEPWLPAALERMLAADRTGAAELLVSLLPAQALAAGARNADYDLELAELGCYRVLLADGRGAVEQQSAPRGRRSADFRIETDAAGLLALLRRGGALQRGRDQTVRVRGTLLRRRALHGLAPVYMAPAQLARAGIWLDPELLYGALSQLVDPAWVDGHDFWISHEITEPDGGTWHLHVGQDGLRVGADAPPQRPAARIRTSWAHFQHVLGGEEPPPQDRAVIAGDAGAIETLSRLVELAQGEGAAAARALA